MYKKIKQLLYYLNPYSVYTEVRELPAVYYSNINQILPGASPQIDGRAEIPRNKFYSFFALYTLANIGALIMLKTLKDSFLNYYYQFQFTEDSQYEALKYFSAVEAFKFTDNLQLKAFKTGKLSIDKALEFKPNNSDMLYYQEGKVVIKFNLKELQLHAFVEVKEISLNTALQLRDAKAIVQLAAIKNSFSINDALEVTSFSQLIDSYLPDSFSKKIGCDEIENMLFDFVKKDKNEDVFIECYEEKSGEVLEIVNVTGAIEVM